jgi:hypothetical protein
LKDAAMAQFDQAARYLVKRAPLAFYRWVIPDLLGAWTFRRFVDTSTLAFPGEPDRVCDTVAEFTRIGNRRQRCLVDAEMQAEPHPDMLERLGEYTYRLRRELRHGAGQRGKYAVLTILFNLTGAPQVADLDITFAEVHAGAALGVVLRTLRDEDAAATLRRIERGELERPVLPWVALMRGAGQRGIIQEWRRLALQEPDSRWRSELGALALVFAELAKRQAIWKSVLGEWSMKQSQVVLEWQAEARQEATVETRRADLVNTLQWRFGLPLPEDLTAALAASTDADELLHWLEVAVTATSLLDFRNAVGH